MNDSTPENIQSLSRSDLKTFTESLSSDKRAGGEKYIVFFLDEKLYAVSARQVVEVIPPMPVTPLPKAPVWLSGIINLRGRIISVIDLSKLRENQPSALSPKSKMILLRSVNGEASVTFAVDRLGEIVTLPRKAMQAIKQTDVPYLLGRIDYKSEELFLVDADKIYSFICFCLETGH